MPNLITSDYTPIDVHAQGGILVTTSRNVAAVFEKEHYNVLKDIERIISQLPEEQNSNLTSGLNKPFVQGSDLSSGLFIKSTYKTEPNGRDYPEYLITKDGLTLLVMGYTGEKAMAFKIAYIKRFNEMEQALKSQAERVNADQVQQLMSRAQFLLNIVGIEGNQMALALDKVHKNKTGESLLALAGVELVRPQQCHLACPSEIGARVAKIHNLPKSISGQAINKILAEKGYQERINGVWTATEAGKAAGATYLDVNKAHSQGAPVTQMKWPIDILDDFTF